jgi:hypothetical protein
MASTFLARKSMTAFYIFAVICAGAAGGCPSRGLGVFQSTKLMFQFASPLHTAPQTLNGEARPSRGFCALRHDNEAGKGDHKHVGECEVPYRFLDLSILQADFWVDVTAWRAGS